MMSQRVNFLRNIPIKVWFILCIRKEYFGRLICMVAVFRSKRYRHDNLFFTICLSFIILSHYFICRLNSISLLFYPNFLTPFNFFIMFLFHFHLLQIAFYQFIDFSWMFDAFNLFDHRRYFRNSPRFLLTT